MRDRCLSRRAQPESVRLTDSPGLVRLWGNLFLAPDGLKLIPNAFALGSPPIHIAWNEVRFAEVVRACDRTAVRLSLSDASTVWIETAPSRADEIRYALSAAGVKPNPDAAS